MNDDKFYFQGCPDARSLDIVIAEKKATECMRLRNIAPLKLDELQQAIQDLSPGKFPAVKLIIFFNRTGQGQLNALWMKFCSIIRDSLPNVTEVRLPCINLAHDQRMAKLLQHLPPSVSKLSFQRFHWDVFALTLEQIGKSFPQLEELCIRIKPTASFTVATGENLALTLNRLPLLREIPIGHIFSPYKGVKPVVNVVNAILRSTHLEEVGFERYSISRWERDTRTAVNPILRLVRARKRLRLMGESVSCEDVVNELCGVSDSIDCLYHILSENDPAIYTTPVIEASLSCKRQRTE